MVEQNSSSKPSSVRLTGRFVVAVYPLFAPQNTTIDNGNIVGSYRLLEINLNDWKDMPHVALANILTYDEQGIPTTKPEPGLRIDPKSVERFVRTYGGFRDAYGGNLEDGYYAGGTFEQEIAEVAQRQESLRRAWSFRTGIPRIIPSQVPDLLKKALYEEYGELLDRNGAMTPEASATIDLAHVEDEIGWKRFDLEESHFSVKLFPGERYDEIALTTDDLWKFISYLFLRDFLAGKIGVCGNPDCPAPYYLKSRSDQKFCQSGKGECTAYAQRQYALKWWHEKKQGKKAKKGTKSPRRKRQ
ncbi:MAG: hypothetical protein WAN12_07530 [Candidatus Acidiferrum sp.]